MACSKLVAGMQGHAQSQRRSMGEQVLRLLEKNAKSGFSLKFGAEAVVVDALRRISDPMELKRAVDELIDVAIHLHGEGAAHTGERLIMLAATASQRLPRVKSALEAEQSTHRFRSFADEEENHAAPTHDAPAPANSTKLSTMISTTPRKA